MKLKIKTMLPLFVLIIFLSREAFGEQIESRTCEMLIEETKQLAEIIKGTPPEPDGRVSQRAGIAEDSLHVADPAHPKTVIADMCIHRKDDDRMADIPIYFLYEKFLHEKKPILQLCTPRAPFFAEWEKGSYEAYCQLKNVLVLRSMQAD